jgi:hypothetical protein
MARLQRAIDGVRSEHRHVRHALAELKSRDALAELIDFADDVVAHHKGWAARSSLRVEMTPDQRVGVLKAAGEHADPHLARTCARQGSIDQLQTLRTAEAAELNDAVAWFAHMPIRAISLFSRALAQTWPC